MRIDKITDNCCGCRLCENICPQKCITFELNNEGFMYPVINDKCVGCGLCKTKCPSNKNEFAVPQKGYMAFAKDCKNRKKGSSGGIFGLLAKEVIKESGIVFGAAFDEDLKLVSKAAETEEELECLYRSKYIQCDVTGMYEVVKKELEKGRKVLVCNTPCNVQALKNYLGCEYDNLLLVDFVCHGVGSQEFFDKCIKWYNNEKGMKISKYLFREKVKNSPTPCMLKIHYNKSDKILDKTVLYIEDPYYLSYQKRLFLRPSCYECIFAKSERCSDITLGDFHEVEKYEKKIDRMEGVSMVLVNSSKGNDYINKINPYIFIKEEDIGILVNSNECLMHSAIKPKMNDVLLNKMANEEFSDFINENLSSKNEWKKMAYYKMPKQIRKILKKVILGE